MTEELIKPMLCKDGDESMLGKPGFILQQKFDGSRVVLYKRGHTIQLIGRSFKNDFAPMYPQIVEEAKKLPWSTCTLDAELTFFEGGRDVFITALATDETKASYQIRLMVFDILEAEGRDLKDFPLQMRLEWLGAITTALIRPVESIASASLHKDYYQQIIQRGGEGVILKDSRSPYIPDARKHWYKVKKVQTADCVIMGITQGTGVREATFGALILGQYDQEGKLQPIANCSGFTQEELSSMHETINRLENHTYPHIKKWRGEVQKLVIPKLVVEVEFMNRTDSLKLRFPRFIRIRTDKSPEQCTLPE